MATTSKTLFRGAATTTVTTLLYTVPASTTTVITNIGVTNTSSSSQTFTLSIGTAGSEVALHSATTIDANAASNYSPIILPTISSGESPRSPNSSMWSARI